jgi:Flp pilus assembly protein TadG
VSRPGPFRHPDLLQLWASRSGATAVEMAFILPLLLLVLLSIMEFGRLAWTRTALEFAVQEASRCGSVRPDICGSAAQIANYAASRVTAANIPASAFSVSDQACGKRVRAEFAYRFVAYSVFKVAPLLTAQVCRP